MKDEYVLYLDESEFKKSKTFVIAGIAVRKDQIILLEKELDEIKQLVWSGEYIKNHNPVLHCTELQKVYDRRFDNKIEWVKDEYKEIIGKEPDEIDKIYTQIYGRMSSVLKKSHATVFSCVVKIKQLHDLYFIDEKHNGVHLIDDKYNIALQKIIENYTHYLSLNDGYGDVIYESRNAMGENSFKSPDVKLIDDYHKIQANSKGIVYTSSAEIQKRNRTIFTNSKNENLAGLILADFVAYNILKYELCKVEQQRTDFMKLVHRISYNGGHKIDEKDQRSFWGLRVLPSYLQMEQLIDENKKLKNAYNNLKKEKNRIKKLYEKSCGVIDEQKELITKLEEQIIQLQKNPPKVETEIESDSKIIDTEDDN